MILVIVVSFDFFGSLWTLYPLNVLFLPIIRRVVRRRTQWLFWNSGNDEGIDSYLLMTVHIILLHLYMVITTSFSFIMDILFALEESFSTLKTRFVLSNRN